MLNIKNKKRIYLMILFMFISIFQISSNRINAVVDHSNSVVINDWNIYDSNSVALSENNGAKYLNDYKLNVTWSISLTVDTLQDEDTFNILLPVNAQYGSWSAANSAFENFKDENNNIIGQWRIYNGKINVILNENAVGLTSITTTFITGNGALKNNTTNSIVQDVDVNGLVKKIKFVSEPSKPLNYYDQKYAAQTSNSRIRWGIAINNAGPIELSQKDWGSNFTIKKNSYFEDELQDGSTSISLNNITSYIIYPTDLDSGTAGNTGYTIPVTNKFTKVIQNSNETYSQYKARLKALEWGVFIDGSVTKLIINFGDIGNNNLKYSDLDTNFANNAASGAINSGQYDESDRLDLVSYFNKTYGDSNVINGNVARYVVSLFTDYNKVILDTDKNNTATVTMNNISKNLTAFGKLQGISGNTVINTGEAGLHLFDEDDNSLLPGASFKLQYLNAGVWTDYNIVSNMTSDADGHIKTPMLIDNKYRFVQLTASSIEYDLINSQDYSASDNSVVSQEFTIDNSNPQSFNLVLSNVKYKYNVIYNKGTNGSFENQVFNKVVINSKTPEYSGELTSEGIPIGEKGYEFVGWDSPVLDKVTKNMTYTAQWKPIIYPIIYILDGGTNDKTNPNAYQYGTKVEKFSNATKAGYDFIGWYDTPKNGKTITSILENDSGAKTLYAYWKKQTDSSKTKKDKIIDDYNNNKLPKSGSSIMSLEIMVSLLLIVSYIYKKNNKIN